MIGLSLENVTKLYQPPRGASIAAVDRVNFSLGSNELLTVVGPVGSGKTTLLRLIAGLERPSSGNVRFESDLITHDSPQSRRFAMLFQSQALYAHLNVEENLAVGLRMRGLKPKEIRERVEQAVQSFHLTSIRGRVPECLSGGERQRVALGRALVQRPRLWLLDEPFSGLDLPARRDSLRLLLDLHANLKSAMIVVTHDQNEALALGDRVALMREGRIEQINPPRQLCTRPENRWVAEFMSPVPVNFFDGTLISEGERFYFSESNRGSNSGSPPLTLDLEPRIGADALSGSQVCMALRAESVTVTIDGKPRGAPGDMEMTVDWVEPAGASVFVHGRRRGVTLVALAPADSPWPPRGAIVSCRCSSETALFFEATAAGQSMDLPIDLLPEPRVV